MFHTKPLFDLRKTKPYQFSRKLLFDFCKSFLVLIVNCLIGKVFYKSFVVSFNFMNWMKVFMKKRISGAVVYWLLLHNFIQQSLNSVSALVQILQAACRRIVMARISDKSQLEIRLNAFRWPTIPQKQFIIIVIIIIIINNFFRLLKFWNKIL